MLVPLLAGTVALGLVLRRLATMVSLPARRRIVTHAFWCPFRDRPVTAEFEVDEWTLRPTDVRECSAFDPVERVPCHKRCRDLPMAAPAARR